MASGGEFLSLSWKVIGVKTRDKSINANIHAYISSPSYQWHYHYWARVSYVDTEFI